MTQYTGCEMNLEEILYCYISKDYHCSKKTFTEIVALFCDHANAFETDWRKFTKSEQKTVFKKGAAVSFGFDYSGSKMEVQVIFEHDRQNEKLRLSVGNWGFPFEPLLSKGRYTKLFDQIHAFISEGGRLEYPAV
ncbi:MAG: hypothetical protein HRT88_12525 [Lentisphaeraceae bacterium]|nr:hypothetical protein [Lentisphaeraceae bacterium]